MNAPVSLRDLSLPVYQEVGTAFGLLLTGIMPGDVLSHAEPGEPLVFLARKVRDDLSLLDLCNAEVDLERRLAVGVRIVLESEAVCVTDGLSGTGPER